MASDLIDTNIISIIQMQFIFYAWLLADDYQPKALLNID